MAAIMANARLFSNGTFNIDQFQLYPENAVWDAKNCLVYIT